MNAHDVDLYLFRRDGAYLYDTATQPAATPPPAPGSKDAGGPPPPGQRPAPSNPPVQIMPVSDTARFRAGTQELRVEWGAIDPGIVSQNISLFCAATGLKTRPRASMDRERVRKLLNLKETQILLLNHPVGYARK